MTAALKRCEAALADVRALVRARQTLLQEARLFTQQTKLDLRAAKSLAVRIKREHTAAARAATQDATRTEASRKGWLTLARGKAIQVAAGAAP